MSPIRPGLAKAPPPPPLRRRQLSLIAGSDGRWRALFEEADVVSEGARREESRRLVYYGTTSIVFTSSLLRRHLGEGVATMPSMAAVAATDPHVRLRAMRVAHREAVLRAGGALGPISAEMTTRQWEDRFSLEIDVTANVVRANAVGR